MINAYSKLYISRAQSVLACMYHHAVHDLGYTISSFHALFLKSPISQLIEEGDSSIIAGHSSIELLLELTGSDHDRNSFTPIHDRTPEYWTGWALSFFQWQRGLKFSEIEKYIPIEEIALMYNPYHEMDISHFTDHMYTLYQSRKKNTNLKMRRNERHLTQKELAWLSDVPLRTIQQYEQRQKSINAAGVETVTRLAQALNCSTSSILE